MSEDEPLVVKYMLMFMYTGKLMIEDIEKAEKIELSYFSFVAGLHAIADKYLVTDLIAHTTKIVQDDVPSFSWYSLTDIFSRIAYIYDLLPENNTVLRRPLCQVIKRDYELMQRFLTDFGTSTENCYTINAAMDLIHKTAASNPLFALDLVKMTFPTALTTLPLLDTGFESTRRQVPEACVEEYFKGMMEDWDRWLKLPDSKGPVEEDGTIPWFVYKPAEPVEPYIPPSSGYQIAMDLLK